MRLIKPLVHLQQTGTCSLVWSYVALLSLPVSQLGMYVAQGFSFTHFIDSVVEDYQVCVDAYLPVFWYCYCNIFIVFLWLGQESS